MARTPKTTKAIIPIPTTVQHRPLAGTDIMPVEVYRVPDRHPPGDGPWSAEPDKVSWIDPATAMPCIMRRGTDGALRGYVGVGPDHPLAGFGEEALPHDPPIVVHGGVDHASPCEEYEPHETSVCHVRVPRAAEGRSSTPLLPPFDARTMVALAMLPDELLWFGFACDKSYDLTGRRVVHVGESVHDLFAGEQDFERFYRTWVFSNGLVGGDPPFGGGISMEGHAALAMLVATRPSLVRGIPVGSEAVAMLAPSKASDVETAAWLDRIEAMSAELPFRFERRELWRKPAVALVGDGLGGVVPLRRTLWMQSFSDNPSRDRFHVWLAHRLDRWEAWGGMAYQRGAPVLTQHLLAMIMTAPDDSDAGAGSGRGRRLL